VTISPPIAIMTNIALHDIEVRRAEHLAGRELVLPGAYGAPGRRRTRRRALRMPEDLRDEEDDETLADAGPEERRTIAAVLNRVGDDRDEERCARRESRPRLMPAAKPRRSWNHFSAEPMHPL